MPRRTCADVHFRVTGGGIDFGKWAQTATSKIVGMAQEAFIEPEMTNAQIVMRDGSGATSL